MAAKTPKLTQQQSLGREKRREARRGSEHPIHDELSRAVEKAENIIAGTDARPPVSTTPSIRLNEAKFARVRPAASPAWLELRYGLHDLVHETSRRLRGWGHAFDDQLRARPKRTLALAAGVGLIGAVLWRRQSARQR